MKKKVKFKLGEAVVFEPKWAKLGKKSPELLNYPLYFGELVYFISEIPNIPSHCIVARHRGSVVPMVHTSDFRKAKDHEL